MGCELIFFHFQKSFSLFSQKSFSSLSILLLLRWEKGGRRRGEGGRSTSGAVVGHSAAASESLFYFFLKFFYIKSSFSFSSSQIRTQIFETNSQNSQIQSQSFRKKQQKEGENIPLFKSDTGVGKGKFQVRFRFSSFFFTNWYGAVVGETCYCCFELRRVCLSFCRFRCVMNSLAFVCSYAFLPFSFFCVQV